ncbi:MAG: hypothetical protein A2W90_00230 [Bacteroidetes bacterium GWF2_42_66]|nr:MAG: hypothetical protein A2W92_09410 [Bacteroidetes bacterium GWA2_42_15]OFX97999.1 MAG: hypothetical protein A2W89_07355 [Bacteroidetes bacterium GWE2_42_39]OFY44177.1 MAG: hypothetical protein A2W90_00230 [Bacteroidetes bacterium GWF2_42_66]HBL74599.1 hypothetical protein [Prolixibacteraceae bacterium]HCR91539.1 hypothetical protein [Prolixibacteraceae bacterium]
MELQSGDLLFRGETDGRLSKAIDRVTQTNEGTHFSHVGLVEAADNGITVLHASPVRGVCRVSLYEFLHPEGDSVEVVVYRLKKAWQPAIPRAVIRAGKMLGKPYNFSYILSDTAHYCSEFIYRAFASDSVFELNPMTFKDPQTGDFSPAWIDYYRELGLAIPEGLPGCNPNGMAASEKLERLGKLK